VKNAVAIITSLYGSMMEGKTDFESVKEKRAGLFFKVWRQGRRWWCSGP
jgi:hypothetical protein